MKRKDGEAAKMRRGLGILGVSPGRVDKREKSDECTVGTVASAVAVAASTPPPTAALKDARLFCPSCVSRVSFFS